MSASRPYSRLKRPLTVLELVQIQKMFCSNRGYKDLIRDFKEDFDVILDKPTAKRFIKDRSWSNVLLWLTGEVVVPPDKEELKIPELDRKKYELLEAMIKQNKEDNISREKELKEFEASDYYFSEKVKYFNFPLYGEIITYKFKEPFVKCFMFDTKTGKVNKIEDVPILNEFPDFLLRILRKINSSKVLTSKTFKEQLEDNMMTPYYVDSARAEELGLKDIFESSLFKTYKFTFKS